MIDAIVASPWGILLGSFASAAVAVELVRRRALHRRLLDIPNERSSHTTPTARGGGLGVLVVIAAIWLTTILTSTSPLRLELIFCLVAMSAVGAVGLLDDRRGVAVGPRLTVHLLAGLAVAALSVRLGWHWSVALWWIFLTVSSINVVNFMDGIDGLVASQIVIAMLLLAWLAPAPGVARPLSLAVAGATSGFLLWNWPPARIFLGDVGSGALGFALVLCGALVMAERGTDVVRVFLPIFPLFLDATATLVRRARAGERLTAAHRSHLYQRLANGGWGHGRVTTLYAVAAILGAFIATVPTAVPRWTLIAAYGVAVVLIGARLDRHASPSARRGQSALHGLDTRHPPFDPPG